MKESIFRYLTTIFLGFAIYACSSIDGDAKRAAKLYQEAKEYKRQQNYSMARQSSREATKIIKEYEKHENVKAFHQAYSKYKREYK